MRISNPRRLGLQSRTLQSRVCLSSQHESIHGHQACLATRCGRGKFRCQYWCSCATHLPVTAGRRVCRCHRKALPGSRGHLKNHEDHRAQQHGESFTAKFPLHVFAVAWDTAGPQQHPSHHLLKSHLLWRSSVHDPDTERAPFRARHSPLPRASFRSCVRECRAGPATVDRCAITQSVPAR